jgi:hypothetical protein
MQGAKDTPHQIQVAAILVQLQKSRLQLHENLARLFPEALLELIDITHA